MSRILVAVFGALLMVSVGCQHDEKHGGSGHAGKTADACTHCPGVQKATADGKCPVCAKSVSAAGSDECPACPGTQVASADSKCPGCGAAIAKK
jgi:hypothetical protein